MSTAQPLDIASVYSFFQQRTIHPIHVASYLSLYKCILNFKGKGCTSLWLLSGALYPSNLIEVKSQDNRDRSHLSHERVSRTHSRNQACQERLKNSSPPPANEFQKYQVLKNGPIHMKSAETKTHPFAFQSFITLGKKDTSSSIRSHMSCLGISCAF